MKNIIVFVLAALCLVAPFEASAAEAQSPAQTLMSKLHWRSIGPYIGGRVVAIAGVPSDPDLFYMGGVQGGGGRVTVDAGPVYAPLHPVWQQPQRRVGVVRFAFVADEAARHLDAVRRARVQ